MPVRVRLDRLLVERARRPGKAGRRHLEYTQDRRTLMDLFYWAMLGGLVGTVLMDTIGKLAGKLKIPWGG